MQKKQVKIFGFQAENCKMKLFYETDGEKSRYIVEYNRKYIHISKGNSEHEEDIAKHAFFQILADKLLQKKLLL